ncbi:MAG: hypothetical protein VKO39_05835 [Cyanobacteriota bacterium]|nr:hypothetical protein [Cyanobacteriota bacterium]
MDDSHQASLRQLAMGFAATNQGAADLARGMHKALTLRESVWS